MAKRIISFVLLVFGVIVLSKYIYSWFHIELPVVYNIYQTISSSFPSNLKIYFDYLGLAVIFFVLGNLLCDMFGGFLAPGLRPILILFVVLALLGLNYYGGFIPFVSYPLFGIFDANELIIMGFAFVFGALLNNLL